MSGLPEPRLTWIGASCPAPDVLVLAFEASGFDPRRGGSVAVRLRTAEVPLILRALSARREAGVRSEVPGRVTRRLRRCRRSFTSASSAPLGEFDGRMPCLPDGQREDGPREAVFGRFFER